MFTSNHQSKQIGTALTLLSCYNKEGNTEGYPTQGYANNIAIMEVGKQPNTVAESMQRGFKKIDRWCKLNGLSVNPHSSKIGLQNFESDTIRIGSCITSPSSLFCHLECFCWRVKCDWSANNFNL